ncbi:hypothetical protein NW759_017130 [Fusarium solani]|nr:hypothetical protein NW759_017130 [Fusarium solani]
MTQAIVLPNMLPPPEGVYSTFEDLMDAVQPAAEDQGYKIVKRRAPTRYDLVCECGGVKYKSTAKKRKPSTQKTDCPFRAKAVWRVELGHQWHFTVQNSSHNHKPRAAAHTPEQNSALPSTDSNPAISQMTHSTWGDAVASDAPLHPGTEGGENRHKESGKINAQLAKRLGHVRAEPVPWQAPMQNFNARNQPISPRPSIQSTKPWPQSTTTPSEKPLEKSIPESPFCKHMDGYYSYPECVKGVPVDKIDKSHDYWERSWPDLVAVVEEEREIANKRHHEAIEDASRRRRRTSKTWFLTRVGKCDKILKFLDSVYAHPYQLLSKEYTWTKRTYIPPSVDTLYYLVKMIQELEESGLDDPIDIIRKELHGLFSANAIHLTLSQAIHRIFQSPDSEDSEDWSDDENEFMNIGCLVRANVDQSQGGSSNDDNANNDYDGSAKRPYPVSD